MPTPPTMRAGERRPFTTEHAGARRKFSPKRWSHQQKLDQLKGKKIEIMYVGADDWGWTGTLIEADQFALEIQVPGYQSVLTVFKHDLRAFREA